MATVIRNIKRVKVAGKKLKIRSTLRLRCIYPIKQFTTSQNFLWEWESLSCDGETSL